MDAEREDAMPAVEAIQPGKKLLALLIACHVSQADIARALGLSRKLVSAWYTGRQAIAPKHYTPLLRLASTSTIQFLNTRFSRTRPLTREDVQAETPRAQTFRRIYEAIHQALDEYTHVYDQVLATITDAEQTICSLGQTPIAERPTILHDQVVEAATVLIAYSRYKEDLQGHEWALWQAECRRTLELLKQWEDELNAKTDL
jgi:transcriptional regulator with XRE-family HTH domain